MKRFLLRTNLGCGLLSASLFACGLLSASLFACGGSQHASDEALDPDQQRCMDDHTRRNALTSMSEAARAKLNAQVQQALFAWVHDLSYEQCTDNQSAATEVLHRKTSIELKMTGSDVPTGFGFDAANSIASGVVELAQIPVLAARPDVTQVNGEGKMEPNRR